METLRDYVLPELCNEIAEFYTLGELVTHNIDLTPRVLLNVIRHTLGDESIEITPLQLEWLLADYTDTNGQPVPDYIAEGLLALTLLDQVPPALISISLLEYVSTQPLALKYMLYPRILNLLSNSWDIRYYQLVDFEAKIPQSNSALELLFQLSDHHGSFLDTLDAADLVRYNTRFLKDHISKIFVTPSAVVEAIGLNDHTITSLLIDRMFKRSNRTTALVYSTLGQRIPGAEYFKAMVDGLREHMFDLYHRVRQRINDLDYVLANQPGPQTADAYI